MMEELQKLGFREMVGIARADKTRYLYLSADCGLQDSGIVVDVFPGNPAMGGKVSVVVRGMYLRKDCVTVPLEHAGGIATSHDAKSALVEAFTRLSKDLDSAEYYVDISKTVHQIWTRKMLDAIKGLDD